MKILFLHGLESSVGGTKPSFLRELGHEVYEPSLPADSFSESVYAARAILESTRIQLIVGSSRGGAIAMKVCNGNNMVLIAPAYKKYIGTGTNLAHIRMKNHAGSVIINHSMADEVIPLKDSEELLSCGNVSLNVVGECHRMNDPDALDALEQSISLLG